MPVFPELVSSTPLTIEQALDTAISAGQLVAGTTYPNPPVGCVVLDAHGFAVGVAGTEPVGGRHAEPQALAMAGEAARGGTAVVTLEPCNHEGRTPPCTGELIRAGISTVVFAVSDPNPVAAGGAAYLRHHGIDVVEQFQRTRVSDGYLRPWLHWQKTRRPHFTLKTAGTLDGLCAATDGTSQWITGDQAREQVHRDRSRRSAIIVGTGTVMADNPRLTARRPDGSLYAHQPERIVVGTSEIPADAAIREVSVTQPGACAHAFRHIRTHNLDDAVEVLSDLGMIDCLIEGGPRLAGAFMHAGLIDAIESYVAPALLGAGTGVISSSEMTSISDIRRFRTTHVELLGDDVLIQAIRRS